MINTILFDLDGTLLPMDPEKFEKEYFKMLALKFMSYIQPDILIKCIWDSTKRMVMNTESQRTNEEIFFENFIIQTGQDPEIINSLLSDFYVNEFRELSHGFKEEKTIIQIVDMLLKRGYNLVLATNPIFPMAAILERVKWAGLKKEYFKLITSLENMHYCKPNLLYYQEILSIINKKPEECIMIGNDVGEDMIASGLGICTFLLEDCIIDNCNDKPAINYRGDYHKLYNFLLENFPDLYTFNK